MNREHQKARWIVRLAGNKFVIVTITGALLLQPLLGGAPHVGAAPADKPVTVASTASGPVVAKLSEDMLTAGAKIVKYQWKSTRSNKTVQSQVDVIEIDLTNPYVQLDVMTGKGNQFTTVQSVTGMAKETGAVAGVNGDYFNMNSEGVPMGAQISQGDLMSSPSQLEGMYAFGLTKDRVPVIDQYEFHGTVTAEDGAEFPLTGINKAAYTTEPNKDYSHANAMYIYTSAWKEIERPRASAASPVEVLVQDGVIAQISDQGGFAMAVPENGYILRTHGQAANFVRDHLQVGQKLRADYGLKSKTTQAEVDPSSFQMMIGGHTILVENGQPSGYTRSTSSISGSSARARTAVGYSKDQKKAYILTVEKNDTSSGMTLKELQNFMVSIGVWKAVNLDGGGSTTMATRPLGEFDPKLTHLTEYGTQQRRVVNGLGVYTTAPQGELKGLAISGEKVLFVGQQATYAMKGYDIYYNPVDTSSLQPAWSAKDPLVTWNGQTLQAVKPGKTEITAKSGSAKASINVEVIGGAQIDRMAISTQAGALKEGAQISVPVTVTLKDGRVLTAPSGAMQWEFIGFQGSVSENTLTVSSVNPNASIGYAIARYDGFSTMLTLTGDSDMMWEDFENVNYPIQFNGSPSQVTGQAAVEKGVPGRESSGVLRLKYDMTQGSGKMYAYAEFNGANGRDIPGTPSSMSIDVMGDGSLNWLRAELTDANGSAVYIDLAKYIDWTGWQTLEADLTQYNLSYPVKLKRIYPVNVEEGQDERALTGELAFDNIIFRTPISSDQLKLPRPVMQLKLNQKTVSIDGNSKKTDVAPIQLEGTTYVPIRMILDEFGGSSDWNAKTKGITVLRGNQMIELRVDQKEYIAGGVRKTAEVSPIVRDGRTLVPLRLVSEQLGLKVTWEPESKSITIN